MTKRIQNPIIKEKWLTGESCYEESSSHGGHCGETEYQCGVCVQFALLCRPQLTTYRVNVEQMAKAAVDRILVKIRQGGSTTVRYTVPGEIIVRESSKKAGALTGGPENI